MANRVLVIEDEHRIAHWVRRYFERDGYDVSVAQDGVTGLSMAREEAPDLIILDRMLPRLDGMAVCRLLRAESDVPILMLTARGEVDERVAGLEVGADDYVVKPFQSKELVARAKALLRRAEGRTRRVLRVGGIELDVEGPACTVDGSPVALGRIGYRLLETFMRHPDQVLARDRLVRAVYDDWFEGSDRAVDTQVSRLRRRIEADPRRPDYIHTVYGVGYKLSAGSGRP